MFVRISAKQRNSLIYIQERPAKVAFFMSKFKKLRIVFSLLLVFDICAFSSNLLMLIVFIRFTYDSDVGKTELTLNLQASSIVLL
ncbi:hypothetical protein BCT82_05185 [Vibrio breoganii]|nr:hypothetical protein BCT82_05185 [Vibrio breoganii]